MMAATVVVGVDTDPGHHGVHGERAVLRAAAAFFDARGYDRVIAEGELRVAVKALGEEWRAALMVDTTEAGADAEV